jgi:hypothetical protein
MLFRHAVPQALQDYHHPTAIGEFTGLPMLAVPSVGDLWRQRRGWARNRRQRVAENGFAVAGTWAVSARGALLLRAGGRKNTAALTKQRLGAAAGGGIFRMGELARQTRNCVNSPPSGTIFARHSPAAFTVPPTLVCMPLRQHGRSMGSI